MTGSFLKIFDIHKKTTHSFFQNTQRIQGLFISQASLKMRSRWEFSMKRKRWNHRSNINIWDFPECSLNLIMFWEAGHLLGANGFAHDLRISIIFSTKHGRLRWLNFDPAFFRGKLLQLKKVFGIFLKSYLFEEHNRGRFMTIPMNHCSFLDNQAICTALSGWQFDGSWNCHSVHYNMVNSRGQKLAAREHLEKCSPSDLNNSKTNVTLVVHIALH